jgi:hypothetical protein
LTRAGQGVISAAASARENNLLRCTWFFQNLLFPRVGVIAILHRNKLPAKPVCLATC